MLWVSEALCLITMETPRKKTSLRFDLLPDQSCIECQMRMTRCLLLDIINHNDALVTKSIVGWCQDHMISIIDVLAVPLLCRRADAARRCASAMSDKPQLKTGARRSWSSLHLWVCPFFSVSSILPPASVRCITTWTTNAGVIGA